ncbi:MAG: hypothetical protein AAGE01_18830, partial [Pseudomonadota bacterium]
TVFWLDGEIALDDPGLRRESAGKYNVVDDLTDLSTPETAAAPTEAVPAPESDASPAARRPTGKEAMATIEAEAVAEERAEMEARYNLGRPIESTVSPAGLLTNDVLYRGGELTVVVRRDRVGLKRYWLVGELDFAREELEQTGSRKYRVRRVIR